MSFLIHRADHHARVAENYRRLANIVKKFGLIAKSGDQFSDENWPQPDGIDYWPSCENSVLLCKKDTFPEHVAAVRVHSDGFYGAVIGIGGNHDLNGQELSMMLEQIGLTPTDKM